MTRRLRLLTWWWPLAWLVVPPASWAVKTAPPPPPNAEPRIQELAAQLSGLRQRALALQQEILFGPINDSRGVVALRDLARQYFTLKEGRITLDGRPLPPPVLPRSAETAPQEITIAEEVLTPGQHLLKARWIYALRDNSLAQLFRYLRDYRFVVESTYPFEVVPGQSTKVLCTVSERGEQNLALGQRLIADCQQAPLLEQDPGP